jgi:pimeloyl-ACP methyl ester carboxylesterase/putative sterol carrier protein
VSNAAPPLVPSAVGPSARENGPDWLANVGRRSARDVARVGRYLDLPSPQDALARALERRVAAGSPLSAGEHALITFDAGHAAWTVTIEGDRMHLLAGRVARPDTVVYADAITLLAVVEGTESGADAFLAGRLRIRGNMTLALLLEGVDDPMRPVRFPRARMVRARDVDTFCLDAGAGPPVVLLHGLGATSASMLPTLAELSHDHRVLAVDLPGFGASGKPQEQYDPAFFARWLTAFLDAAGIERAHLIGNSMGGRIAIEMGLRSPERVDRLVLFAPSLAFKRYRTLAPMVRLLAAEMGGIPMRAPRALVTSVVRGLFARPERVRDAWYDAAVDEFVRVFADRRGRIAFFSAARQIYLEEPHGTHGFWERLPSLSRPALFLWGDRDRLVPSRFGPHVVAALPTAQSIVLDDCGHVPQFEHPARTHRLVREFLGSSR